MSSGGRRSGAGRPRGSKNKQSIERQRIAEELLSNGVSPLQVLIEMMRGTRTWDENVFEAAKAAAPYLHPRLNATNVTADVTTTWEEAVSQVFYDGSFAGDERHNASAGLLFAW